MAWRPKRGEASLGEARTNLRDLEEAAARAALRGGAGVVASATLSFPGRTRVWQDAVRAHVEAEVATVAARLSKAHAEAAAPVLGLSRAAGHRDVEMLLCAYDADYLGKRRADQLASSRKRPPPGQVVPPLKNEAYEALVKKKAAEKLSRIPAGTPKADALPLAQKALEEAAAESAWVVKRDARTEVSRNYNAEVLEHLHRQDTPSDRMYKKLVEVMDERTGKDSVILNAQVVLVDHPFEDWWFGGTYDHPPNRYNDRATILPWRASYGPIPTAQRPTQAPLNPRDRPLPRRSATTSPPPAPTSPSTTRAGTPKRGKVEVEESSRVMADAERLLGRKVDVEGLLAAAGLGNLDVDEVSIFSDFGITVEATNDKFGKISIILDKAKDGTASMQLAELRLKQGVDVSAKLDTAKKLIVDASKNGVSSVSLANTPYNLFGEKGANWWATNLRDDTVQLTPINIRLLGGGGGVPTLQEARELMLLREKQEDDEHEARAVAHLKTTLPARLRAMEYRERNMSPEFRAMVEERRRMVEANRRHIGRSNWRSLSTDDLPEDLAEAADWGTPVIHDHQPLKLAISEVNPLNGRQNCSYIVDALLDRLTNANTEATAPDHTGGREIMVMSENHDTSFIYKNKKGRQLEGFDAIWASMDRAPDGANAMIHIQYRKYDGTPRTVGHIVLAVKREGKVHILEGQSGGAIISTPEDALARYGSEGCPPPYVGIAAARTSRIVRDPRRFWKPEGA